MSFATTKMKPSKSPNLLPILGCFFFSGAAGLIYEVAWAKALALLFGHTTYATATVLAVFMAGLATGSAYLGRWAEHKAKPTALYGRVELLVAVTGSLSLLGLALVRFLYVTAYPHFGSTQSVLILLRLICASLVLLVPTFLMGGTFPILVSAVTRRVPELGFRVSQVYWVNTLGAATGTLLSGFVLLPALGLRLTVVAAATINALVGILAVRISQKQDSTFPAPTPKAKILRKASPQLAPRFLLIMFGVVGFTAFAYELAWTRQLAVTIGSSTYAFTLMLTAFLIGTVIGSALFQRFYGSSNQVSSGTLSRTQLGVALAAISSLILFHWIPSITPTFVRITDQSFVGVILAQFVTSLLTLLPVATLFGFNFPLFVVFVAQGENSGNGVIGSVGNSYAANTAGAIAGSLITGFWLIPLLGSYRVIAACAIVNVLVAIALDLHQKKQGRVFAFDSLALLTAIMLGFYAFPYDHSMAAFSALLYGNSYGGRLTLAEIAATKDLVFTDEGTNASVAVERTDNSVALTINGKVDASTYDARTQLLLGHLGAAFHSSPRRVLIIGFGSGMTASAVARYPDVERIDCVEIEPAVLRAAPYLNSLNRGVLKDPRLHIIFDDARNFLLTTPEKYDLIISEPSNPWMAGVATLFTNEFYSAARQHLTAGGIFVQWVQAYSIAPDDLRMIFASFSPHFPAVTLWRAGETDLLLLGRTDTAPFQLGHLRRVWAKDLLRSDFGSVDIHRPEGLFAYFLLDDSAIRKLARSARLNTDDRTLLEYDAPRSLFNRNSIDADEELISSVREGPLPKNIDLPEIPAALEAGVETALDINDVGAARMFLKAMEEQPPSLSRYVAQGRLNLVDGKVSNAKSSFQSALRIAPDSTEVMHWLAITEHRSGDDIDAESHVHEALKQNPRFLPALTDQMQFALDRKDYRAALLAQLSRIAIMGQAVPASEYCRLGAMWASVSNFTEAESALSKGLLKDPYSYSCHVELGGVYGQTGRLAEARQNLEWAIQFFPAEDPTIYRSLAAIDNALGDKSSAKEMLQKGDRIFPNDKTLHSEIPH